MPWNLDSARPIYLQIIERVQMDIVTGQYQPGDKLPSVRDLAQEAAVNPNTMQKALSELERSGLIYSQRTSGRFITEDKELIHQMKQELAAAEVSAFCCPYETARHYTGGNPAVTRKNHGGGRKSCLNL